MRGLILALALASVTMSAVAQVLFKLGMSAVAVRDAASTPAMVRAVALSPGVLGGLGMYSVGTVLWLGVLSRAELSQAYPFVGLSFVLTAIFGVLLFHDAMPPSRIAGVMAIVAGVWLVGRS